MSDNRNREKQELEIGVGVRLSNAIGAAEVGSPSQLSVVLRASSVALPFRDWASDHRSPADR